VIDVLSDLFILRGAFAQVLTTTRRNEFVDGNRRRALSVRRPDPPCWSDGPGLATTHGVRARHDQLTPRPRNHRRTADQGYGG
jgi:hypothetical protein